VANSRRAICSFASVSARAEGKRRERRARESARVRALNLKSDSPVRPIRPSLLHRRTLNLRFPWRCGAYFARERARARARAKERTDHSMSEINKVEFVKNKRERERKEIKGATSAVHSRRVIAYTRAQACYPSLSFERSLYSALSHCSTHFGIRAAASSEFPAGRSRDRRARERRLRDASLRKRLID